MTLEAPAKINLGLHVLRKRDDGFHDLESVFLRIGWADRLSFAYAEGLSMTCSDPSLPTDGSNLCMRAAQAVLNAADSWVPDAQDVPIGLAIHLEKRVPHGGGLGGGSSDAATCLEATNEQIGSPLSLSLLHDLAAAIGSDVPFFLMKEGVALGTGRGEILSPMAFPRALRDTWLVVVAPDVGISTAEAYGGISPRDGDRPDLSRLVRDGTLDEWRAELVNDFETSLFPSYPQVAELKDQLYAAGAGYASMSGSGSAVFGVFTTEAAAQAAMAQLGEDKRSWVGPSNAAVR